MSSFNLSGKNIALIVMDTVSAFHLPFHGHHRDTAPFLESLAEQNTVCRFAYSNAPWTVPSHASIFSGKLPKDHGATAEKPFFDSNSVVEQLSDRGYETYGFTANSLVSKTFGFDTGFDELYVGKQIAYRLKYGKKFSSWEEVSSRSYESDLRKYLDFLMKALRHREPRALIEGYKRLKNRRKTDTRQISAFTDNYGSKDINSLAQKRIGQANQPFFAFFNYMDAHDLNAEKEIAEKWVDYQDAMKAYQETEVKGENPIDEETQELILGLYDAQIRYIDSRIEELMNSIQEEHPDTVFIITSDHGENLGHYGMWGHQHGIWERLIRVPLIIAGKNVPEKHIEKNVSLKELRDLMAGEKDLDDLGTQKVFSEYHGHSNLKKALGQEMRDEENNPIEKNQSRSVVKDREGFISNTEIENRGFRASKSSYSEQNNDTSHLESELASEYSVVEGIDV